ncbi:MAG TPA: SRPBCC domain-containing protein [Nitrososphaeraceae archaeon]
MNGKYDVLKKEIVINAPVEKVYSALITPEQLTQWFPNIVTIEPKIGGKISFRFLKESTQEDKDHEIVGEIVSFIPNKEISYTWNFTTKPEYNKNTIVTWKLEQLDKDKQN